MSKPADFFETKRLIAHKISTDDLDDLIKMHSDIKVMRTLGGRIDFKETIDYTKKAITHWNEHSFGVLIFRDKETKRFIGKFGFEISEMSDKRKANIEFAVVAKYWQQGYASEIVEASIRRALEEFKIEELSCYNIASNLIGEKVMSRAGFTYQKDVIDDGNLYTVYKLEKQKELV